MKTPYVKQNTAVHIPTELDTHLCNLHVQLAAACRSGDLAHASALIDAGAPLAGHDPDELPPLHIAVVGRHVDMVQLLIDRGADVRATCKEKTTALHDAARAGSVEMVQALLKAGAEVNAQMSSGSTPLHKAMLSSDASESAVISILIEAGASMAIKDKSGCTPLHDGAFIGCVESLVAIVSHGGDLEVKTTSGETPLVLALGFSNTRNVLALIAMGADTHTLSPVVNGEYFDLPRLHAAARAGLVNQVNGLLKMGQDVDRVHKGFTPLAEAKFAGHPEVEAAIHAWKAHEAIAGVCGRDLTPRKLA